MLKESCKKKINSTSFVNYDLIIEAHVTENSTALVKALWDTFMIAETAQLFARVSSQKPDM